uniref:Uncharacterized protein n=1 Tax=Micrurus paraensis TaxID=1970185 RepID=A0A2D4KBE1_9SAUR
MSLCVWLEGQSQNVLFQEATGLPWFFFLLKTFRFSARKFLCLYVHNNWCTSSRVINRYCCPDLEVMTVMCRPFYLPRELTVVIFTAVYIPPNANISTALAYLHITINKQLKTYPDGAHIITGDFIRHA